MSALIEGIGKALSWLFNRLPTEGQSLRNKIEKLESEYERVLQKPISMARVHRLRAISSMLRVLYAKAANKVP